MGYCEDGEGYPKKGKNALVDAQMPRNAPGMLAESLHIPQKGYKLCMPSVPNRGSSNDQLGCSFRLPRRRSRRSGYLVEPNQSEKTPGGHPPNGDFVHRALRSGEVLGGLGQEPTPEANGYGVRS